jgi:sugar phosphate permease
MIYLDCPNIKASLHGGAVQHWYFGWNIVAAATLLTLLTAGMRLGIGPFFLPMSRDLGFSRSLFAGIIGAGVLCYGLAMALAGYLVGRLGTRSVLLLGTAIVIVSTIWTVVARTPLSFLLAFGVLLSVGLGFASPVALTPIISRWFTRQRGMAFVLLVHRLHGRHRTDDAGADLIHPLVALANHTHWLRHCVCCCNRTGSIVHHAR